MTMMIFNGVVIQYNKKKGYGFIRTNSQTEDIFVHISQVKNRKELLVGQKVEFKIKETSKGLNAIDVIAGATQKSPYLIFSLISIALGLTIFFILKLKTDTHTIVNYLISINITTFLLYGYDKFIASTNALRVPELNLHALSLLGGSPAGLVAQKFFRHKTIKGSFQALYWFIVILQIVGLWWIKN